MAPIAAPDLLSAWEQGLGQHAVDRALTMLSAAQPGAGREELARLPIGERDARLWQLHRAAFGDMIEGSTACPRCRQQLQFALDLRALAAQGGEPVTSGALHVGGVEVTYRQPDSHDLAAAAACATPSLARRALLDRCVRRATVGDLEIAPVELPAEVVASLEERLSAEDPRAETLLDLRCEACGERWQETLDVATFVWHEVAAAAAALLRDVHVLAGAYGWSEADILTLSPARRRAYLDLAT
jgi:hypothetical protein